MACLSEMQKGEVETLAAVLNSAQIADYFGIGRRTFFSMIARDPEIAALYKKGKANVIGSIAQGLIAKARSGDTASMIFYLKTQAGWSTLSPGEPQDLVAPEQTGAPSPAALRLTAWLDTIAERTTAIEGAFEHLCQSADKPLHRIGLPSPRGGA